MKDKTTAALLGIFLGGLGVHRFYLGQHFMGIIYLLFCWTFIPSFIGTVDGIVFLAYSKKTFDHYYNKKRKTEPAAFTGQSAADEVEKLYALKKEGAITEEEFQMKKEQIFGNDGVEENDDYPMEAADRFEEANRASEAIANEIARFERLRDAGIITEDEFQRKIDQLI